MRKPHSYLLASLAAFAAVASLFASPITSDQARTAATQFVASDPIGSAVLKGRSVQDILDLDGLWVATLSPSGHVIFSGSDLVEPIVGFSAENFASPDPDSPASDMLDGARRTSRAAEESGVGSRNAKWAKFLAAKTRQQLRAASVDAVDVSQDAVIIPPFLQSHYNQLQPYNDFCPVYDASDNEYFRGRSPCGCVATATAQVLRHFRWPSRIDKTIRCSHSFVGTNDIQTTFPILFNGYTPINWDGLVDDYIYYTPVTNYLSGGGYMVDYETDLRGAVAESERYPVARLVLLADVMAQMSFGVSGSSANYESVASSASDWYTQCQKVDLQENAILVRTEIECGVPCFISVGEYENNVRVGGHAVIAHGWAEYGDTQYVYINFGYGGQNDGYYNIAEDFQEYSEKKAYVGFYPRAKPQLEPLPKVCGNTITLNWDFPDFYTNNLDGFDIAISKPATETAYFLDDFENSKGYSTAETGSINGGINDKLYVREDVQYGSGAGKLLYAERFAIGEYFFPDEYVLTSASVLTFKLRSIDACAYEKYEIQARYNGGEWETVVEPPLTTQGDSGWGTQRVYLGDHGGQRASFRLKVAYNYGSAYTSTKVLLDDFQVTDVLEAEEPTIHHVTATDRSYELSGLDAGSAYTFTVTPRISGALVDGETSDPVSTIIEGSHRVPIPGVQTYHTETLSFSASVGGAWSYSYDTYGSVLDDSSIMGILNCGVTANLQGAITADTELSFRWSALNYQNAGTSMWKAVFVDESGSEMSIGSDSSTADVSERNVILSLSSFAGQKGSVKILYSHSGSAWQNSAGILYAPTITNVLVPDPLQVEWDWTVLTDIGTPEIISVSNVVDDVAVSPMREGFFRECKYGETTYFDVECSENVVNLNAYSSHLALVGERQTTVRRIGGSTFRVAVDASNIGADRSRSRLILTLEAIDGNGTKAYKDLSLRFSEEGEAPPVDPLEIVTGVLPPATSGVPYAVSLEAIGGVAPYSWTLPIDGYDMVRGNNTFSLCGMAKGWQGDDDYWKLELPFTFPFYYSNHQSVWVGSNGTLSFGNSRPGYDPKADTLAANEMIAVLWKDLKTMSGDIYVEDSSSDHVTIRWDGVYYNNSETPVSFSATLYADGRIRLSYGSGNASGGFVGISSGQSGTAGVDWIQVNSDTTASLENALDVAFMPRMTLPSWLSLSPSGVLSGTPTASGTEAFTVFVTDGADTRSGKTLNLTVVSVVPVVMPGIDTVPSYNETMAAVSVDEINANKTRYIATPEVLEGASAEVKAEYQNMFKAKAEYVATVDAYRIVTELTPVAERTLASKAEDALETVAEALGEMANEVSGGKTEVSVAGAQPGFYYSISYGVEPDALDSEGVRVQAPASGNVTLKTPLKSCEVTDRGFYRVNVNVRGW